MRFDESVNGAKYLLSVIGVATTDNLEGLDEATLLDGIEKLSGIINNDVELWDMVNEIEAQLDIKDEFNEYLEINRNEAESVDSDLAGQLNDGERSKLSKALSRMRDDNARTQKEVDTIDSKLDSLYDRLRVKFEEYQIPIGKNIDRAFIEDIQLKLDEFDQNTESLIKDLSEIKKLGE